MKPSLLTKVVYNNPVFDPISFVYSTGLPLHQWDMKYFLYFRKMNCLSSAFRSLLLLVLCCTGFSGMVYSQKNKKKDPYINDDSLAIYSTHSSRPFKYGFPYTKEECERYFREYINGFGLRNGEKVADVGAASGWLSGIFSVMLDSMYFYIQDIDTHLLNTEQFHKVTEYYTAVRERPQTNQFIYIIGTGNKTLLPENTFDKILLNNSFHEIKDKWAVLEDLYTKLKPGGQLIVHEKFSNWYKTIRHPGCGIKAFRVDEMVYIMEETGFYLTGMAEPWNAFNNYLVFETSADSADAFTRKRNRVAIYTDELEKLYEKKWVKDSANTIRLAQYLQKHLPEIRTVYQTIEHFIDDAAYFWMGKKQYAPAMHILRMNLLLYPHSANVYDSLGEVYLHHKKYGAALEYYARSLELDPGNTNAEKQVGKIRELMKKK